MNWTTGAMLMYRKREAKVKIIQQRGYNRYVIYNSTDKHYPATNASLY